jgi:hypothetical protein
MTTRPARDDILDLERRFWNTMRDKDGAAAARMTATPCVLVGAQGVSAIDPASMTQMMQHGQWTLKRYAFDDESVQIQSIDDDTAIIAYAVMEDLEVEGKPMSLHANDSSVWVRRGGPWVCVLHTESVAGDPFGRDRQAGS